jgi:glycosyltransferase involved in cell wall biosynthesis
MTTVAVVPALDEESCVGDVVRGIAPFVDHVVVVDNGSKDRTPAVAREAGADVVLESRRGYGYACLAGIARARDLGAKTVLFLDGDGSDAPEDAAKLLGPVVSRDADLTLGVRRGALVERGAMTSTQRFGNWLGPALLRWTVGAPFHDMPPFKACAMDALGRLGVADTGHGFTIELLIKAHRAGLRVLEVDVRCRARKGGVSKVSGDLRGASRAAVKIMTTIARHALAGPSS